MVFDSDNAPHKIENLEYPSDPLGVGARFLDEVRRATQETNKPQGYRNSSGGGGQADGEAPTDKSNNNQSPGFVALPEIEVIDGDKRKGKDAVEEKKLQWDKALGVRFAETLDHMRGMELTRELLADLATLANRASDLDGMLRHANDILSFSGISAAHTRLSLEKMPPINYDFLEIRGLIKGVLRIRIADPSKKVIDFQDQDQALKNTPRNK